MLQPSHRGIYEYLWSEHKYQVLGVSVKALQNLAAKLGRQPHILHFLRRLEDLCAAEKPEWYNALLCAYMLVKPALTRQRRFEIIETLLSDQTTAAQMIYDEALVNSEKTLYGCRLFFSNRHALYKFWDAQDKPGLWLCFGPFQLHITTPEVFCRVACASDLSLAELQERLHCLKAGISNTEFNAWPEKLKFALDTNQMVATPGHKAYLHPRIILDSFSREPADKKYDLYHSAAFALEKIWDGTSKTEPMIGNLPDFTEFIEAFNSEKGNQSEGISTEEAWDFLAGVFWEQQCRENGLNVDQETSLSSGAGIGMETADEEIDPEEGEHGNDETYD